MRPPRPVFGIDIDGTIAAYHDHYLAFAEQWLGRPLRRGYDGSVPLWKWCGTSRQTYRQTKLAYRMGGMKRSMPLLPAPLPQARELTKYLNKYGDVYLCTSRPYLSHDNIDGDTRHWVRRNGVVCSGIIWGEHKYRELARMVGVERVVTILDDIPAMCLQAHNLGIPAILAQRQHNDFAYDPKYWPARTHGETVAAFDTLLLKWKAKRDERHDLDLRPRALPHQRRATHDSWPGEAQGDQAVGAGTQGDGVAPRARSDRR